MKKEVRAYCPDNLPVSSALIKTEVFLNELIDASTSFEVYKEKIKDSKLDRSWFLPTLQQKEALASAMIEGTQATIDGVLVNQVVPDKKDKNIQEISNYNKATEFGYRFLKKSEFDKDFFLELHKILMMGKVRRQTDDIGVFRNKQNYIGNNKGVTYTPPEHDKVESLIDNLLQYIKEPSDGLRPLIRTAIIHAQFETIHPFMDGNGRVGRILIPLYLYYVDQIDMPCFFVSEALERDKIKYYTLLNNTRDKKEWSEWIKFFLVTVKNQCDKYIKIISDINTLYERDLEKASSLVRTGNMRTLINLLYKYPVINASTIAQHSDIPVATINRYLNVLVEASIIYTDNKSRNRNYFYFNLIDILRK
ncbi:Fic family protein [Lachnospiraceae bacterium PF1-21]|uniref:Fic family protein n=1 Tax=Ohessyouella blattaphilus TaxID=2949333 RepID=UPI003E329E60